MVSVWSFILGYGAAVAQDFILVLSLALSAKPLENQCGKLAENQLASSWQRGSWCGWAAEGVTRTERTCCRQEEGLGCWSCFDRGSQCFTWEICEVIVEAVWMLHIGSFFTQYPKCSWTQTRDGWTVPQSKDTLIHWYQNVKPHLT